MVEIPAQYETVFERVRTQCETCTRVWVPAVTQLKSCEVCVRPACTKEIDVPGVYRTETVCCDPGNCCSEVRKRQICIEAPSKRLCYTPALYRTDTVPCVVKPGYWQNVVLPAVYEQVPRLVCKCPARWVPASAALPAPAMPPPPPLPPAPIVPAKAPEPAAAPAPAMPEPAAPAK